MCIVCRSPQRLAAEARLRAGTSLRAIEAEFPALNRNSLSRHNRMHMTDAPAGTPATTGCAAISKDPPQNAPAVRHRTRPQTDAESRLRTVMLMLDDGYTYSEIARHLNIHPSTAREVIVRAERHAVERVRAQTVDKLVAQRDIARQARARNLARLQEQAEARNDVHTQLDIAKIRLTEERLQMDWMDKLGAFDHFRIKTHEEHQRSEGHSPDDLIGMAKQLFGALAADDPVAALEAMADEA
ncbi:hypothetical protein OCUBac02_08230 [Bosea sp. ANAM02]|nr:hypothetical protein OCUBac02_08230 [Bosea sp. ANAM02]